MKHIAYYCILFFGLTDTLCLIGDSPEPYRSIKTLPYVEHGWFPDTNKAYLLRFIEQLRPKVVVEVGSWLGLSTMEMAYHLQSGARLYAVDTWQGSVEHIKIPEFKAFLPTLFRQFLSNVKHKGLTEIIVPIRMSSLEAAASLEVMPQLIYIDASHAEEDVYNDIIAWYKKLTPGGILCGDDWNAWASVRKGVLRAVYNLRVIVHYDNNFWYFDPK